MKKRILMALTLASTLLLAACTSTSEPNPEPGPAGNLVGVWVFESEADNGIKVYSRAAALAGNRPGYEFSEHGGLKVRKSGWCGTPPVTWSNLDGLWSRADDRLLDIRHAWRGGPRVYQIEIMSLGHHRLTCRERTDDGSRDRS